MSSGSTAKNKTLLDGRSSIISSADLCQLPTTLLVYVQPLLFVVKVRKLERGLVNFITRSALEMFGNHLAHDVVRSQRREAK